MFLGEYRHTLDAKGRVSLPARFRSAISPQLVVSKGFDGCLYVYTAEEHLAFLSSIVADDDFDKNRRAVRRFFANGAVEVDLDSAGRVSILPTLREYAKLTKDVMVVGNGDRIEIWDAAAYAAYNEQHAGSIEEMAAALARGVQ